MKTAPISSLSPTEDFSSIGTGTRETVQIITNTSAEIIFWRIAFRGNTGCGDCRLSTGFIFNDDGVLLQSDDVTTFANDTFLSAGHDGGVGTWSSVTVPGPVPEPTTLTLFATGLAGLGFMGLRRRRMVGLKAA